VKCWWEDIWKQEWGFEGIFGKYFLAGKYSLLWDKV